jgi:hypothetical protein
MLMHSSRFTSTLLKVISALIFKKLFPRLLNNNVSVVAKLNLFNLIRFPFLALSHHVVRNTFNSRLSVSAFPFVPTLTVGPLQQNFLIFCLFFSIFVGCFALWINRCFLISRFATARIISLTPQKLLEYEIITFTVLVHVAVYTFFV